MKIFYTSKNSCIGRISILWVNEPHLMVKRLIMPIEHDEIDRRQLVRRNDPVLGHLFSRIEKYLSGDRKKLPTGSLDWSICTDFQRRVLQREWLVPYGRVISYQDLAADVKDSSCCRAIGSALSRNPFPIIIPCHRTVRSDGSLGGFRGGLGLKRSLLEKEGIEFGKFGRIPKEYFWKP